MSIKRHKRRLMGEINVVPYIDVMLVLLIIFMVTAPLLAQGVKVELPQAAAEPLPVDNENPEPVVLTVNAQGELFLNIGETPDLPLQPAAVRANVAKVLKHQPNRLFLVKGDNAIDYGTVVAAMTLLQQAGVPEIGLVTEPPDGQSAGQ